MWHSPGWFTNSKKCKKYKNQHRNSWQPHAQHITAWLWTTLLDSKLPLFQPLCEKSGLQGFFKGYEGRDLPGSDLRGRSISILRDLKQSIGHSCLRTIGSASIWNYDSTKQMVLIPDSWSYNCCGAPAVILSKYDGLTNT